MVDTVQLLGRILDISVEPGAEGAYDTVRAVIEAAANVLNTQWSAGQLNPTEISYIDALRGLGVAAHRGFTPCAGTADDDDGEYVFFIGADDIALNDDPEWYASTMIHDGGHAWLSQQGQPFLGIPVEQALTRIQIDYYAARGDRPTYIANLETYIANPALIQDRINQVV